MVESNSNRSRSPSVFKTVQVPDLITLHIETHFGYYTKQKLPTTAYAAEMCFYMAGAVRFELTILISKTSALGL